MREEARGFYDYLVLRGRSRDTAYQNARHVHHFLEWLGKPATEATREDVMNYVRYLRDRKGYSTSTVKNVCYSLSSFFVYLGKRDLAEWVPRPVPKPGEVRWLPEDVVMRVVGGDPVLRVAYELALRVSELLLLRRDEYNPETGTIAVYRLKHKGKPNRYILQLSDETRVLLNDYLESNQCPDGRVFCMSRKAVQARFRNALAKAGLDPRRYTFHVLRHSRCTNLVIRMLRERGTVDLLVLSKFMGHLSPSTTMSYVHIATKALGVEVPIRL
jgi:site-specific recombinase XerD